MLLGWLGIQQTETETLHLESSKADGLHGLTVTKMLITNMDKLFCSISEPDPKNRDIVVTLIVKETFSYYFVV